MKLGFLSADWGTFHDKENDKRHLLPGGSGWYRIHMPALELRNRGYEIVISEQVAITDDGIVLMDWVTGEEHDDCDVIVMQRVMNDFALEAIDCAHAAGQAIVNDVDDYYWGLHPSNNAYHATDPKKNASCNRNIYKSIIAASDLVTVSTPFLAEKMSAFNSNIALLRNAIDLDRWKFYDQNEVPVVGWVGATSHRSGDLETLKGVVGPFVERNGLRFHHSGWSKGFPHACELLGVELSLSTSTPLCPIEQYPQQFKFFDISLVPLNKIDFNQAKSWIKGLESAISGRPFIAQDTDEYRHFVNDFGIGRVARKPRDWIRHLDELLDYDVRVAEAESNRKKAEAFDIQRKWVEWEAAYKSVLG